MIRITGIDPEGRPRVYAIHNNFDVAETWCRREARIFLRGRFDLGPYCDWRFEYEIINKGASSNVKT